MIQINLIPDVKLELLKAQRTRSVVISASIVTSIVAIAAVAALLVYMFAIQGVRHSSLNKNIYDGTKKIEAIEDLSKILTIKKQLETIDSVNDQKHMTNRMFDLLSAITLPSPSSVTYNSISFSAPGIDETSTETGGIITIDGQTDSFATLEVFKKTIENAVFVYKAGGEEKSTAVASDIQLGEVSYGEDSEGQRVLRFSVKFAYAPELFAPSSKDIAIKISINGNVTDSYLNIPRFTERAADIEEDN